ncbi:hypothetical protein QAD02_021734 [Eretmocerus hayati]|uniref:Uncharacterized protein n=1 Tax=Eretmocerus hayati TaxID=131215 RepID=A0ACC2PR13_9HYME|nr:hypothetical protein QAD02_021734 [Eretmocerus hayati]
MRKHYVFWCTCGEESGCECDKDDKDLYYDCIIFSVGASEDDCRDKVKGKRCAFPTNPEESPQPSHEEDSRNKQDKLKRVGTPLAKKLKVQAAVKRKTYLTTIDQLKRQKPNEHSACDTSLPSTSSGITKARRNIRDVLQPFRVQCKAPPNLLVDYEDPDQSDDEELARINGDEFRSRESVKLVDNGTFPVAGNSLPEDTPEGVSSDDESEQLNASNRRSSSRASNSTSSDADESDALIHRGEMNQDSEEEDAHLIKACHKRSKMTLKR